MTNTATIQTQYARIMNEIRGLIHTDGLLPGMALPSQLQLAERLGVSDITVRRALKELEGEGLVYSIYRKGTYVASSARETRTLSIVLPRLSRPQDYPYDMGTDVAVVLLDALLASAHQMRIRTQLHASGSDPAVERQHLEEALVHPPDGMVIMLSDPFNANEEVLRQLRRQNLPMVLVDRSHSALPIDMVGTDNLLGAQQLTESLIDMGFTAIHHFTSEQPNSVVNARREGYETAMQQRGLPTAGRIHAILHDINPEPGIETIIAQVDAILAREPGPVAFFALNSHFAQGVWRGIRARARPGDWARTGIALFDQAMFPLEPGLRRATAIQPFPQIANVCLKRLFNVSARNLPCRADETEALPQRILLRPLIVKE